MHVATSKVEPFFSVSCLFDSEPGLAQLARQRLAQRRIIFDY